MKQLSPRTSGAIFQQPASKRGKTLYFAKSELSRLVRGTLREAKEPLSAYRIAADALAAKGLPLSAHAVVTKMVLAVLGALTRRGELVKSGVTRNVKWAVAAHSEA